MMMIICITIYSGLVPLIEGLCLQIGTVTGQLPGPQIASLMYLGRE